MVATVNGDDVSIRPEPLAISAAPDGGRANILIVDDRPDKLLVYKTILESLNQNIVTMQSGEEALRWLLDNECAVLLLDVNMPGMDGFETAQLIRGRRRSAHTPIIFITAHADEIHTEKGYSLGAVDYMLTPASPSILRSKVTVFVQLFNLTQKIKRQADEHVALAREQAARAAAEELTRRASFLAEVSKILISSLDVNSLMVGATRLVIPMLADLSAITLVESEGTSVRTACGHEWNLDQACNSIMQHPMWVEATKDVLATGQLKIIESLSGQVEVSAGALADAVDGTQGSAPAGASGTSRTARWRLEHVVMLPLAARDKMHGVLALAYGPSGRRFGSAELELAIDTAARITIALDNCLLFKEIQEGDQRKNEFLATLSHELRNPLAPMRTALHALHLSGQWPPGAQGLREMLERQLGHLTHLVNDLLDVARIRQGKIQLRKDRINVVTEVEDALETCRASIEEAGHELEISLPAEPMIVEGDPVRLQQIFENLIVNAGKYTEPPGRIEVRLERVDNEAVFRIRDSGVGIAPEMMTRIWEMFAQVDASSERSRHGLGIGLSLARKLVNLHGGEIEAHSEGLGKGSEFVVHLPLVESRPDDVATPVAPAESGEESAVPAPASRRILVVDDNTDAAQSLEMLLGVFGHQVEVAHDGTSALQAARSFKPDLVFMDIGMPGMSGYEVAQCFRGEAAISHVKLIALSGYGTQSDQQRSKEAGFDRHLVKPVDPEAIPAIIVAAFES